MTSRTGKANKSRKSKTNHFKNKLRVPDILRDKVAKIETIGGTRSLSSRRTQQTINSFLPISWFEVIVDDGSSDVMSLGRTNRTRWQL